MLAKPQIHLDIALLHACQSATVIIASERLRVALLHAYDAHQIAVGLSTWKSARVLTLGAYLKRRYDELLDSSKTNHVLLGPHAQRLAWLDHAPESIDIDLDGIYDDIAQAWQTAHDWDLIGNLSQFSDNDNHRLLREWASRYRRAAGRHRWLTEAELPGFIAEALESGRLPVEPSVFIGFDVVPPSVARLIDALRRSGSDVQMYAPPATLRNQPSGITCEDPEHELDSAFGWARDVLLAAEEPVAIGIAVPDVIARYDQIVRQLESVLQPANRNPDPMRSPYNISGGNALAAMPVISAALQLLQWSIGPLHHSQVDALLRSPFLTLDTAAAHSQHPHLPESYDASVLTDRLAGLPLRAIVSEAKRRKVAPLADTIVRMKGMLQLAGWPNTGSLTSESFQAYRAFRELLDELIRAGTNRRTHTFVDTLTIVRNAARRSLFAPIRPNAPLHVLGYLETANLQFTHLWVVGMSDLTWPGPARPNAYIPLRLLRRAGAPRIDVSSELAFARRLTSHWRCAAPCVVFSNPRVVDESRCRPSRLIDVAPSSPKAPYLLRHPFLIRNSNVTLETQDDAQAGPIGEATLRTHGSEILRDQSACAFRAFARYRLHLTQRPSPHSFPDATERGTATHLALRRTFDVIGPAGIGGIEEPQTEAVVTAAAASAVATYDRFPRSFVASERRRLTALVLEWLRYEHGRLPSKLVTNERAATLMLGTLLFQLQIDRIDEFDEGGALVIDYKTGAVDPTGVFGERPEEPQLAMYALSVPNVEAIAFALVKHDDCRFAGWSNPSHPNHGAAARDLRSPAPFGQSWPAIFDSWRVHLTRLTNEFRAGAAQVAPRNAKVCRECDLHSLCRIREMSEPVADDSGS